MYKKTIELNGKKSRATGMITLVDKADTKPKDRFASFIQIRDCNNTIYLHSQKNIHYSKKARKYYILKVKILIKSLQHYLKHLERIK